ncbi:MAG TPA: L-threonate dehydrogenase [Geminicoccus sp.]|jgi:3-hydroxyisobutyrate dehydrogenase|uniref:L-threonate dehydrogenase n=1 Tax=Geminicoccus sp. TaxID=2024832 RepID=UPI002E33BF8B|nr:L-threonate dehydrogenase [Geminicoccus sp.]HEX2529008.1 L-threonate dehydrogenase [Geminicoccus sp.]
MQVGVIGLGSMGGGMAGAAARAGLQVRGYDVRPTTIDGVTPAASAHDVAEGADILLVMVVNAQQLEDSLFGAGGALSGLPKGAVVIASATIPASDAERIGKRVEEAGHLFLDAPVSGGAARAADGELTFMASGSEEAFAKAAPLLDACAAKVFRLGPTIGTGSTVKTVHQLLAGVHIAAAAEAMALGVRAGADARELFEVICNAAGRSWMFENRVPHMLDRDFAPRSAVEIFVKDLGLVLDTGRHLRFPLPIAASAHQQFLAAAAAGFGQEDDAAVVKVYEKLAGIEVDGR